MMPDPTACADFAKYSVGQRIDRMCTACGHPAGAHRFSPYQGQGKVTKRLPCPLCEFEVRLRKIEDTLKAPGMRFMLKRPQ